MEVPQGIGKDDSCPSEIEGPTHDSLSGIKALYEKLESSTAAFSAARAGVVELTDPLKNIRGRLLQARRTGVDSATIQTEINQLLSQINDAANTAEFGVGPSATEIDSLRGRLKIQGEFIKALCDAWGASTGNTADVMVDGDAARLGALQRQQASDGQPLPKGGQASRSILALVC